MKTRYQRIIIMTAVAFIMLYTYHANAEGLNNDSWSFSSQNRASIAALIKQVEEKPSAQSGYGYPAVTTMICGGDSSSSAKGNASCILLNNSTGTIEIGQDSEGDQTASSDVTETTETTNNMESVASAESDLSDVLSGLNEN